LRDALGKQVRPKSHKALQAAENLFYLNLDVAAFVYAACAGHYFAEEKSVIEFHADGTRDGHRLVRLENQSFAFGALE